MPLSCGSNINLNWNEEFHLSFRVVFFRTFVFYFEKSAQPHQLYVTFLSPESNKPPKVATPESNETQRLRIPKVTSRYFRAFMLLRNCLMGLTQTPREVLPYMGYIGMCGPKGYGFSAVLLINRHGFCTLALIWVCF